MIKFENVTKIFPGDFIALEDIDLFIDKGEFISIVGQSGAGKSTLLKLIYAEEQPTTGKVYFEERPLDGIKRRHLPYYRRNIGTVFQDFKLLPQRTIFENVAYALEVAGETNAEISEKVPKILDIVGLGDKMEKFPKQLSGGEQQRVSLARALIHRPKVIIADEPTGNLDPISTWELIKLLLKINDFGTTILLATHNKNIVDRIGKRVVALDKGKVIRDHKKGKYVI
ncbi:MAG: cell division ATP-binding protein FtsE [Candidatus Moranbacteria bacterium RIFCSPHIGHO2_02_FULL_40_12b]|nr:MAG: cell division ATP-binding protein FtsE [Candidatus Moranbacteria bacterium RIFCSPHIGHO2_02_FULL_40_12b]OGI24075.1 MAG: cell division ATP-binding protein FtsE [Candidatus Moranbacteria bacterium RIFCSPHIGHO2_12_FULL_40_10]